MSDVATTSAAEGTLEQSLNKTDMGHWIYEHRKSFLAAVGVVLLGTVGYVIWKQQHQAQLAELAGKVSQFEQTAVADLKAKKIQPAEFITKYQALDAAVRTTPSMIPVAVDAAAALRDIGDSKAAQTLLKPLAQDGGVKPSDSAFVFVALNYAALAETNGETDEAIKVLEAYASSGHKVFLTKAYLDLGRLYLLKQDNARAKTNLDWIITNHPNDELAKLARLYLQKLSTP